MLNLTREGPVFILTLNDGENRWNTTFVRAVAKAVDEVEASTGAAASSPHHRTRSSFPTASISRGSSPPANTPAAIARYSLTSS